MLNDYLIFLIRLLQAATGGNEVDDIIRELKKIDGFYAYLVLNNDGMKL